MVPTPPAGAAPGVRRAAHDVLVRAVLPAVPLFAVVLALGLAITGPLHGLPAEQGVNRSLAAHLALLAQRIRATWLRAVVTAICVLVPLAVGWSRLYRGMHHVTDVVVGFLVGAACAGLASRSLRGLGAAPATPPRQTRAYRARANE